MERDILDKPFLQVDDVMQILEISKPTAYALMKDSGCLLPINRRKIVGTEKFMEFLMKGVSKNEAQNK
ncbi:MAG: DNA-binding protein [Coriobacteriia bacterium]|nr:DNA-binding protein [Coriobacteriia bacterium]MCL2745477.1 DNA-binding protein [Coriobacteriia bacterium]MCL2871210.1 DNA-binding protein [Coriobacteriia bacterium]